ncbi:amidase signature domain-containing protein [Lentinula raphanica]|uniref:Glutamyl-tRNA(Gln) amidotransferase subunit A, mitochondrial n=1 Tax=Lentinula raphanica TaxID=153919 RepID=A0AA38PF32_9AGAR|nr:amidase signature domain-containing protein [Lentinula raphanica]KAJ3977790.1 amidase signature domain-containing protein [Lentinula raphanica]
MLRRFASNLRAKDASFNAFVSFEDPLNLDNITKGPLNDYTIGVKDNICTSSLPTTCGSAMLRDFTSPFDATVVKLLKRAGAQIVGKTNCDEFGMGSLNIHSIHGPVINPFRVDSRRAAGGSSGGSAAAVAAGLCEVAIGTDTGGSIRLPASYCGVVGFKPSYGLISRYGVVSYADSLDTVGVLAQDVQKVEKVFECVNRRDHHDPTSAEERSRKQARLLALNSIERWNGQSLKGLKIGIPQEYFPSELTSSSNHIISSIRYLLSQLRSLGATIVPVSLPSTKYALSAYYVIASAEGSSCLTRYDGIQYGSRVAPPLGSELTSTSKIYAHTRSRGFGREVRKRVLLGTYALSADAFDNYFLQAQRVRQMVKDDFDHVFSIPNVLYTDSDSASEMKDMEKPEIDGVDVLLHPSAIRIAPRLDEMLDDLRERDILQDYVQDVLTVPASLAGLPALSVPMRFGIREDISNEQDEDWPIGVSIVGQWGTDKLVMDVGKVIERFNQK